MDEQEFLKHIGHRIKSIRKRRGLKQVELAKKIHKTQDAISAYENGKRALFVKDILVLATALQVSPSSLLQNISDKYFSEEFVEGLLSYLYEQDPQGLELFEQLEITTLTIDFLWQHIRKSLRQEIRQPEIQKIIDEEKDEVELIRTLLLDKPTLLGSDILNALEILGIDQFRRLIQVAVILLAQNTRKSNDDK